MCELFRLNLIMKYSKETVWLKFQFTKKEKKEEREKKRKKKKKETRIVCKNLTPSSTIAIIKSALYR